MTIAMENVLRAVSAAMNNKPIPTLTEEDIREAEQQAVLSLVSDESHALPYIAKNVRLMRELQQLSEVLNGIPYLVLKGTSAAVYYPTPIRRIIGDIDIIVNPQCFNSAYKAFENAGYNIVISASDDRHVHIEKDNVTIELHRRFATLKTPAQEKLFDCWLYEEKAVEGTIGRFTFPMPSDQLNGLVLLTHINQHLGEGLGLRHIVDWVMYVKHSLSDEDWPRFQEKTDQLGLTNLAKVVARFGQVYLRINTDITWCLDSEDSTAEMLLDYIFESGNLGQKDSANNTMIMVMSRGRGIKGFFKNLQERGLKNWENANKYYWLRPFAWLYQLVRYVKKGAKKDGIKNLGKNLHASHKRNALLDDINTVNYESTKAPQKAMGSINGFTANKYSKLKKRLRPIYKRIKNSVFCKPLYYLNDFYYVIVYALMGKPRISEQDIKNVETNLTFIYKSFNRQRQAKRLYNCIKRYYPKAKVIIADDSSKPLNIAGAEIIQLPFNSGLSKGIIAALDSVKTDYVMRMDDDELLTPHSNVHDQLSFLQAHPEIDLVGLQATHKNPESMALNYSRIKMNKKLIIPAGAVIEGREVVYKTVNVFIARTDKLRMVGYDPNIRMNDHHEFFYRAAGRIVSTQDPHSYVMHCHNRFERDYDKYRGDTYGDFRYISKKHGKSYWYDMDK